MNEMRIIIIPLPAAVAFFNLPGRMPRPTGLKSLLRTGTTRRNWRTADQRFPIVFSRILIPKQIRRFTFQAVLDVLALSIAAYDAFSLAFSAWCQGKSDFSHIRN
jgi:hypothetical protein